MKSTVLNIIKGDDEFQLNSNIAPSIGSEVQVWKNGKLQIKGIVKRVDYSYVIVSDNLNAIKTAYVFVQLEVESDIELTV